MELWVKVIFVIINLFILHKINNLQSSINQCKVDQVEQFGASKNTIKKKIQNVQNIKDIDTIKKIIDTINQQSEFDSNDLNSDGSESGSGSGEETINSKWGIFKKKVKQIGSGNDCPPQCGHIHNGDDSIALWNKNPLTRPIISWYERFSNDFRRFDAKHDILVMAFFAHLNDAICCVDHAVKAHNDGDLRKCEKDYIMSKKLVEMCIMDLEKFRSMRKIEMTQNDVDDLKSILSTLLESIQCTPGQYNELVASMIQENKSMNKTMDGVVGGGVENMVQNQNEYTASGEGDIIIPYDSYLSH